jgi:hypothetical protein
MTINHVFKENTFTAPSDDATNIADSGTVTVEHDAFIVGTGDNGLEISSGPNTIKIDGYIQTNLNGIVFYDAPLTKAIANAKVTVGAEAAIVSTGAGFNGIRTEQGLDITNSGLIQGQNDGILFQNIAHSSSKTISITNNLGGEIHGKNFGIEIFDQAHDLILKNQGKIDNVYWLGGAKITNSGQIDGLFAGTSGGARNNTITNTGSISNGIGGGGGNDTIVNSGHIGGATMDLNGGNDTVKNSGTIDGSIGFSIGNDTLTNSGSIQGFVHMFAGINKLTNSGSITGEITSGLDSDTMANTGSIGGQVDMGGGNDKMTNGGTITGDLVLGIGDDVMINTGHIIGDVLGGDGNNKFTNGGTIVFLKGGADNDVLTNTKSIGNVDLGDGDNTVTNSGTINALSTGSGEDVIKNTGHVDNIIDAGGGDDKVTGGNFQDVLIDGAGNDTYVLGGGTDGVLWAADGNDTIDGGAGFDSFDAVSFMTAATSINLDSKAVTVLGHDLAASSAVAGASVATLKNFEAVYGGDLIDVIAGSTGNDTLQGNKGNDILYGNKGADDLSGTQDSDTYVYLQLTDSGNTKSTRDTIRDFDGAGVSGGDVIDLSAIDADTKHAGPDAFHLIGVGTGDVAFSATTPGELRWVHENSTDGPLTIIQGDVNGDGKADFSIAVMGTVNFIATDFNL